jgi:hypothetical protein
MEIKLHALSAWLWNFMYKNFSLIIPWQLNFTGLMAATRQPVLQPDNPPPTMSVWGCLHDAMLVWYQCDASLMLSSLIHKIYLLN